MNTHLKFSGASLVFARNVYKWLPIFKAGLDKGVLLHTKTFLYT